MAGRPRLEAIDLWRGFALLTIFVNHIPGNVLEHLTHRNLGFSDGAEAFVFLAGVSIAIAYGRALSRDGYVAVALKCARRAWTLYRAHLLLSVALVGSLALLHVLTGLDHWLEVNGSAAVFGDTTRGVLGLLMLSFQLGYLNILPLYVILMLWAPAALILARLYPAIALAVSATIYVAAQMKGLSLPNWPQPGAWFFNPFAWQFLMTLGIVAGMRWQARPVAYSPALLAGALAILVASAFVETDGLGLVPGLRAAFYERFDLQKTDLAWLRLVHFLALAYALTQVPVARLLGDTAAGRAIAGLGRHGLTVFLAGTMLSLASQLLMLLVEEHHSAAVQPVGLIVTLLGIAFLFLIVRYREWSAAPPAGMPEVLPSARSWAASRPAEPLPRSS